MRQRANRASTHDLLDPHGAPKIRPSLTQEILAVDSIHPTVHRWWRVVWRSPMAGRWLEADVEVLYLIAVLRNQFATKPTTSLAGEIRQQEARLGLDVMARRRFDWRIENSPTAAPASVPVSEPIDDHAEDPRRLLRAVK